MELEARTTLTSPLDDEEDPYFERPPRSTMIPPPPSWVVSICGRHFECQAADEPMFDEDDEEEERETLDRECAASTTWRCPA